jgi:hypothetical protein
VLVRCDTAGATHDFATACRVAGVGFSFGYPVDWRVQDAVDTLNIGQAWYPAIDTDGGIRDGAWVAEATDLVNLSSWPARTRLIRGKERPHPDHGRLATHPHRLRLTDSPSDRPTTKDPLALGKPAPPGDTGPSSTPLNSRTQFATHPAAKIDRHHLGRKIEARNRWVSRRASAAEASAATAAKRSAPRRPVRGS